MCWVALVVACCFQGPPQHQNEPQPHCHERGCSRRTPLKAVKLTTNNPTRYLACSPIPPHTHTHTHFLSATQCKHHTMRAHMVRHQRLGIGRRRPTRMAEEVGAPKRCNADQHRSSAPAISGMASVRVFQALLLLLIHISCSIVLVSATSPLSTTTTNHHHQQQILVPRHIEPQTPSEICLKQCRFDTITGHGFCFTIIAVLHQPNDLDHRWKQRHWTCPC
jgi:hypothetical protein